MGPLLVRQPDVKPNSSSAGLGSAAIGRLHDSGTTSRADHVSVNAGPKTLRPDRDESRKLAGLLVVASERTVGRKPRRAEEHDCLVYLLAAKDPKRLEIFRKNTYWTGVIARENLLVFVSERWIDRWIRFTRFHDLPTRAKSTKPRSTSVLTSSSAI